MELQWEPALATGEPDVDEAHQELFRRGGRLLTALRAAQPSSEIEDLLVFLSGYAHRHFTEEAAAMDKAGYPPVASHHQQHVEFMRTLASLHREFARRGASPELAERLQRVVNDWLRDHISVEDQAFGRWIRGRGRSGPLREA
jgi:hemerythrin-like metal-binding protein